jgi:hypothetical protein
MSAADDAMLMRRHDLNNLLGKILGAAELALDQDCPPLARQELETIIQLAEEGGQLLASTSPFHPAS